MKKNNVLNYALLGYFIFVSGTVEGIEYFETSQNDAGEALMVRGRRGGGGGGGRRGGGSSRGRPSHSRPGGRPGGRPSHGRPSGKSHSRSSRHRSYGHHNWRARRAAWIVTGAVVLNGISYDKYYDEEKDTDYYYNEENDTYYYLDENNELQPLEG